MCCFNIKPPTRDNSIAFWPVSSYTPAINSRDHKKNTRKNQVQVTSFGFMLKAKKMNFIKLQFSNPDVYSLASQLFKLIGV